MRRTVSNLSKAATGLVWIRFQSETLPNISYDVFAGKTVAAPNTYKKRLENMELSCEEVALRWPTIEPPADYDGPDWH